LPVRAIHNSSKVDAMALVISVDPEGIEIKVTKKYVSFDRKDVLEVGCGDGRLTFQYAPETKSVTAIDPSRKAIASAKKKVPKKLVGILKFQVGRGEELDLPGESFDVVFFSWSLCCTDMSAMGRAVSKAWRVLRPQGLLASIQPSLQQPFHYGMAGYLIDRNFGPVPQEDEAYAQSRLALKHSSLVERRFVLVAEEEFPNYTYYSTERELLRSLVAGKKERYKLLDGKAKGHVRQVVRETGVKTSRGIRTQETAVLTVLRKAEVRSPP
jgi:ubiquinone/menaquinone biosynthesis C-methylase UbiE